MPLNQIRVVEIIQEECMKVPNRCPGYRREICSLVEEVLKLEREHVVAATNIKQQIGRRFGTAARLLAEAQEGSDGEELA